MTFDKKVGFFGAGNMAEALAKGFIDNVKLPTQNICCYDVYQSRVSVFEGYGMVGKASNVEVVEASDIIFICTKPQYVEPVLKEISSSLTKDKVLVSIAAGVPLDKMLECLPAHAKVIRVMPNTPCLVGEVAAGMCLGGKADAEDERAVKTLFNAVGQIVTVQESQLNAVTGLSGSGPAYVFLMIEALADGGVKAGLPRDISQQLAAQTVLGAAKMVKETGKHPGQLKDMVCSPGGTTIAAVHELEKAGIRNAFINAVEAATNRAADLSK